MNLEYSFHEIGKREGSPFYLLDREAFVRNFNEFRLAFETRHSRVIVGYSYKTNYIPYLCRLVRDQGGYAEVVSRMEYDLALRIGQDPKKIIFNGPIKRDEDITLALRNGSLLNVDSFGELERVCRFAQENPDHLVSIGIRINIPLRDEHGVSHIQEGAGEGRFGFSPESLREITAMVDRERNLRVNALHGHTSTTCRSLWAYQTITRTLCDVAGEFFGQSIDCINIGGGFFGKVPGGMGFEDVPSYEDYAETICGILKSHPWARERNPILVLEPGMALTADILSFVTQVFDTKCINNRHLAVVDGSVFNVKPTMHKRNNPFRVIRKEPCPVRKQIVLSVVGATCMEKDVLLRDIRTVPLARGDYIKIDFVGAYTVVMTPPFIHPAPAIVVHDGSGFTTIRRRQILDDVFAGYLI